MDTNGCSPGFPLTCFGKNASISFYFLSTNHIPEVAGRWAGLNQPPTGFRDAPTQENQAAPLARLQTPVSNTSSGLKLKADCLPRLQKAGERARHFFYLRDFFSHQLLISCDFKKGFDSPKQVAQAPRFEKIGSKVRLSLFFLELRFE